VPPAGDPEATLTSLDNRTRDDLPTARDRRPFAVAGGIAPKVTGAPPRDQQSAGTPGLCARLG